MESKYNMPPVTSHYILGKVYLKEIGITGGWATDTRFLQFRRGYYRNYYKGHMDKTKGEGGEGGGRWVHLGWGGGMGRKGIQL